VIAEVAPGRGVRLWSRLGNEKTSQFPEIVDALAKWTEPVVLDGELVALDEQGRPAGFQRLQGRIHLKDEDRRGRSARAGDRKAQGVPVACILFDVLRVRDRELFDLKLLERRKILERLFARHRSDRLRLSEQVRGDGRALHERALAEGWEGLIAKRADSLYRPGKRTPDWCKIKLTREQEFVVGGWTEPRQTRIYFGALLLGVYDGGHLVYVGHSGTGFNDRELARVMALLKRLETPECPFATRPPTNERPHWVRPELVAQVRFTEWTADGKLRHPVYLGLRDDKKPREVIREPTVSAGVKAEAASPPKRATRSRSAVPARPRAYDPAPILNQLDALRDARRDGSIELPDGQWLAVTNLNKVFWPKTRLTKGDLIRYYVKVAPFILPALADRPLVMKRLPNGVTGQTFYQHRATDVPAGVRILLVDVVKRPQLVGGDLLTLLYTAQLAAISQDPWFSRVQSPEFMDYAALDLDPMPGLPFARTLEVARWIHDELEALGATAVPKTSGSEGLHVYIPMPRGTPYEAGLIFCQIIATVVAQKHPRHATVERTVAARGKRVYVDFLQNVLGKTLATAYSARASDFAGVSTPLTWNEVHDGIDPRAFTINTIPERLESTGDLWAALRTSKGVNLDAVGRYVRTDVRT
jgi:bifunctional non-homologous end joining protein LigD